MSPPHDLVFVCTVGFVFPQVFFLGLWVFAAWRTRLFFFYIMIVVAVFAVDFSIINVALSYDAPAVLRLLGPQLYVAFFSSFILAQLAVEALSLVGSVLLVRWVVTAYGREKNARSV
jgi:hypothetical protein